MSKSRAHAQSLSLELVSMEAVQSPPSGEQAVSEEGQKMKRTQLIEVSYSHAEFHSDTLNIMD